MAGEGEISQLTDRPPGADDENPYEGVDIEKLPDWWRKNVKEFEEHGMHPYRPPRFEDGTLAPSVISELESELDILIQFQCKNPQKGNESSVLV